MDKKAFLEILTKYNKGLASREEIQFLEAYYELFDAEEDVLNNMSAQGKTQIKHQISTNISAQIATQPAKKVSLFTSKWWSVAAVLLVLTTVGVIYFNQEKAVVSVAKIKEEQPIKPGTNQAILTLADGSTIGLNDSSDGIVVVQNGLKVTKDAQGQISYDAEDHLVPSINTVATPRGGQYQLALPDGTKVWLNAASSIKFPTRFSGVNRSVEVTGEVYFEVARNEKMPFLVNTHRQQIEVLGTHFNVNTYEDELEEKTTLLEGKVKVARLNSGKIEISSSKTLKPGQSAALGINATRINVEEADMEAAVSWKNGYFKFDKADIHTVMRQIARWYDVDVQYVGDKNEDLFVGKIKRTENIAGVLRILELSKIKTSIKGRTIIITN